MKIIRLIVTLYVVLNILEKSLSSKCLRSKRMAKAFRYRPRITDCQRGVRCDEAYHNHILLLTNSVPQHVLDKCSTTSFIEDIRQLDYELSVLPSTFRLVIVRVIYPPEIYLKILNIMIIRLGNVSLYAEGNVPYTKVMKNCKKLENSCAILTNLFPIITQQSQLQLSEPFDFFDTPWYPLTITTAASQPVHSQEMLFALSLCERDRRRSMYFEVYVHSYREVYPSSTENLNDDIQELGKENSIPEISLSLPDILPRNQKHYDKNRPPKSRGKPTIVSFHVTVLSLDSINEESMTYVADVFLAQSWRDQRLRLPEHMKDEYRILDVEWLHDIWKPDCFFKNAKQVTFHEISVPNHYLWLYNDKTLLYMSKLTLVLSCAMKFESYPHDTQICSMMIESLSHTTDDLVFMWNTTDPLVVSPEMELPQLDIIRNYTADCTIVYSTGEFTCLTVVFSLRRRLGYHLFHTYIPSALIVVMSWISFWIKPEAIPARVTLGVTSLLTLATQSTQSQQSLPPVSYVKAIDIWMSSCSVFVFLSLMEFAVVNNYMGPVSTKAMKGYSEEDVTEDQDNKGLHPRTASAPQYDTFCHGRPVAIYIDKFSRVFFPASFIILNIVYWTSFL